MVDFRFDIKPLFPQPIIKVTSNLLPHTFRGDRRQCLDATSKMSEIIDRLGQLSAVSQGLNKPVTTAQRLRMSDNQIIYLLADCNAGQNGAVTGLLKVGTKDLYLFDEAGQTRKVESAPSILDFYVHESRQRAGLGKHLFETMLSEEQWTPLKCSVDRPSEKLLGFLRKHYGLVKTIPQANNFVLYEGYFDNVSNAGDSNKRQSNGSGLHITNSPNTQLFGAAYVSDDANKRRSVGGQQQQQASQNVLLQQITQISPVGRYGAPRPTCSMAEIIHAGSPKANKGGAESSSVIDIEALMQQHRLHDNDPAAGLAKEEIVEPFPEPEPSPVMRTQVTRTPSPPEEQRQQQAEVDNIISTTRRPPTFQLSKQHTGMKNRSFGVGMAVTPTDKMEFDHEVPEDFGVVKINRHVGKLTSPVGGGAGNGADNADAVSTVSSGEGLTDQGYYDLKFYHNKLW